MVIIRTVCKKCHKPEFEIIPASRYKKRKNVVSYNSYGDLWVKRTINPSDSALFCIRSLKMIWKYGNLTNWENVVWEFLIPGRKDLAIKRAKEIMDSVMQEITMNKTGDEDITIYTHHIYSYPSYQNITWEEDQYASSNMKLMSI